MIQTNYQMKLATVKYFFLTFFLSILTVFGQTPEELVNMKNPPKKLVQDYARVFDAMQLNDLENKLVAYDDSTSTQILVLTVESLNGYPLETFANDIGQNWGVGRNGKDNGVVIVLSEQDRKITIRTGYAAQIYLPPSINKSIIDNVIIPHFKQGDYAGGIDAGVNSIFHAFSGKYKQDKPKSKEPELDWVPIVFAIGFFIFIFFIISKGKGAMAMTGNLGTVMKESVTIALEYIRANAEDLGINPEVLNNYNIHIHVPEGATPKDGPSAGIAMLTSMVSSFTQKRVKKHIAMTGEITLRGKVLPVGGIKEKILAAKRANIKEIILCKENKRDIEEIKADYIEGLTFHYVDRMSEVLDIAITNQKVKNAKVLETKK